jgi:hypothetical protein
MNFFTTLTYLTGGFGILSILTPVLTPLLILLRFVGINYYTIRNDEEKVRLVIKYLQKNTISSTIVYQYGNSFPSGTFIGLNCIGFYTYSGSRDNGSSEVQILTTKKTFMKMVESDKVASVFTSVITHSDVDKRDNPLLIYGRTGSFTNLYYSTLRLNVQGLEPKFQQNEIVDDICRIYKKVDRGVFFIHGVTGAGKSTIGLLVAKQLGGSFCHSFNPTDPGDTLHLLLLSTEPSEESPTIIVIEEIDTLIHQIHTGNIPRHKHITTLVNNKSSYNTFFDDLIMYKHVIIIMTSNKDKSTIDALDPCYLREGRIHGNYSMPEALL